MSTVLTGDRPTGPLHLGHYFGSLHNRLRLQELGYSVNVLIADYQVLTDRRSNDLMPRAVLGLVADYMAAGIDPARSTIFTHSQVPSLNQLMLPFLSLVSEAELSRNPTVKDESSRTGGAISALMLTYPVHQAADILAFRADLVPVGKDQLPHVELARTIARRFNERYAASNPYFVPPQPLLGSAPLLLGSDGTKMSKSRANSVPLGATEDETAAIFRRFKTDHERQISYEPERRPEVANLVLIAALCQGCDPQAVAESIGASGAAGLKDLVVESVNELLRPLRERRRALLEDTAELAAVLAGGNERAEEIAGCTLRSVKKLMYMDY